MIEWIIGGLVVDSYVDYKIRKAQEAKLSKEKEAKTKNITKCKLRRREDRANRRSHTCICGTC